MKNRTIKVGLIGLGTVGTGVYKILRGKRSELKKRTGLDIAVTQVCVKNLKKRRTVKVPKHHMTADPKQILKDDSVDIIVELIGGTKLAEKVVETGLNSGKSVVTANKALLAEKDFLLNHPNSPRLSFEAAVCGGIPIIKGIREGLVANKISAIHGILNGTSNYILSQMSETGMNFADALSEAQKLGYAEQDPTMDIDGTDAAHKLAILARLAYGKQIPFGRISTEGIQKTSPLDIRYAKDLGYAIKLIAIGRQNQDGLDLRVHPMLVDNKHPLAKVDGVNNAVLVHGDEIGASLFYGRGAGEGPTASAVVSDIIDQSRNILLGTVNRQYNPPKASIVPSKDIVSRYYLRFQVLNQPGVLGKLTKILGDFQISLSSVTQKETWSNRPVSVVMLTHKANESQMKKALTGIKRLSSVKASPVVIRILRGSDKL